MAKSLTDKSFYQFLSDGFNSPYDKKMVYFNTIFNQKQFLCEVDKLATFLHKEGFGEGDVVTVALPNIPEAVFILYAVSKLGGIVDFIHPMTALREIEKTFELTNSKFLFLFDVFLDKSKDVLKTSIESIIVCSASNYLSGISKRFYRLKEPKMKNYVSFSSVMNSLEIIAPCITDNGSLPGVYLHSGGTSGQPKTVVLNAKAFNFVVESLLARAKDEKMYDEHESTIAMLPIFHSFGLSVGIHTALCCGICVLMPKFDGAKANALAKKHKVTLLAGVPLMFQRMYSAPNFKGKYLKNIKQIFCGGDNISNKFVEKYNKIISEYEGEAMLCEGYGLTEVAGVVSYGSKQKLKIDALGCPIYGAEIKIMSSCKQKLLQPNEVGEIVISSPTMMIGYLNEDKTDKTFVTIDGQEYLRTGDIGSVDDDGFVYFKDREKRTIKISGVNVFPSQVEDVVNDLPEIKASCSVRLFGTDDIKSSTLLYVVMEKKYKLSLPIMQKIKVAITNSSYKYSVPKEIIEVPFLNRTNLAKVDYKYYENKLNQCNDVVDD